MFDRLTIRAADLAASLRFYRTVLAPLGLAESAAQEQGEQGTIRWGDLAVGHASVLHPETTGLHVGLIAPSLDAVRAFWQAGVEAGYESDGEPGPRPAYRADYHGAFLLDPAGNSIEAVRHGALRHDGGAIDHCWVRVRSVDASRRYYEAIGAQAGFALAPPQPGLARFRGPAGGSLTLVAGDVLTRGLDVRFLGQRDEEIR